YQTKVKKAIKNLLLDIIKDSIICPETTKKLIIRIKFDKNLKDLVKDKNLSFEEIAIEDIVTLNLLSVEYRTIFQKYNIG
ncbi:23625_t:CDS:1, partial [Racocetra persica]